MAAPTKVGGSFATLMGLLKYLFVPILKLFVYETKGFHNIPKKGPAILVANHASYIDGPLVMFFPDWHCGREPIGIQSREWLEKGPFRKFIFVTLLGQIPTNGSVAKALTALYKGKMLMLFPEAHRSETGTIHKTKHTGLGVLAAQSKAPIIPVGIEGTFAWWPRNKALPSFKPRSIALRVGKPIKFTGAPNKKNYFAFQHKVMHAVAKLARIPYR